MNQTPFIQQRLFLEMLSEQDSSDGWAALPQDTLEERLKLLPIKFVGTPDTSDLDDVLDAIKFKINKPMLLHKLTSSKHYSTIVPVDFRATVTVIRDKKVLFKSKCSFGEADTEIVLPEVVPIEADVVYEVKIFCHNRNLCTDNFVYERQEVNDVLFIPMDTDGSTEKIVSCSIESFEFIELASLH